MIYICIPALDEARTLGLLLWKIRRVMTEFRRDYEILVLNDGSADDTAEVLQPYTRVLPLTVLANRHTAGYGAAVQRLLREAAARSTHPKRDVAVVMQADFTESPDEVPALVRRIEGGADLVGSVRETAAEAATARWARRALGWLLPRGAAPADAGEPFSGFRAYRVSLLKRALTGTDAEPTSGNPPEVADATWAANARLLRAVAPHVRRAEAVPITLRYDRRARASRFQPWRTARAVWALGRTAPPQSAVPVSPPAAVAAPEARRRPPRGGHRRRNNTPSAEDSSHAA